MNRRIFLTWLGLGWLASTSPLAIASLINQDKHHPESNYSSKGFKPILFYVATNGNDNWSGKRKKPNSANQDGPFATLHQAREAIRELKHQQGGTLQQPVTVFLRSGTYFLSEPLIFTPEDSGTADFPITYKAYRKEKPVISGGQRITGWKQKGNLWVANLPDVKKGKWYFRLLRVEEDWAIRARYPKFEPKNPRTGGWLYVNKPEPIPMKQGNFNSGVGRIHNQGDKIEWNIFVPVTGKYKIWLRYSNNMKAYGVDNMSGRTTIKVGNNSPIPLRNLIDTGNFANFRWQLTATLDLRSGEQKLVWENINGGGLGLDAFCLTDDPDWNPVNTINILKGGSEAQVQQPKQGKHLIIVHAETFEKAVGRDLAIFPEKHLRTRIPTVPNQFPKWQNWDGAEVHIFPYRGWVNAILPVIKVNQQSNTIYINSKQNLQPGNRFFIANASEALDSPGEWCLDKKTSELIYWALSPNFPNDVDIIAPKMDKLIVLKGDRNKANYVENLYFQGLTFKDTDYTLTDNYYSPEDAAIWLSTTRKCTIENCTFVLLGGYGVRMEQGSHKNQIIKNTMAQLGQGGVVLLGDNATQPFNNLIAANNIHDCGKVYKHVAGVYIASGSDNRIVHNRIYRTPRYGVSLKSLGTDYYSHNNIIEFNEIIDTNLETSDTGAIETLGRDKQASGNIIRFNFIHNVVGMGTKANGKIISPYYTWGIYLDDYSSGTTVYGNIVIGTVLGAICIHDGKDNRVENNIFINGSQMQIRLQPRDEFMKGNIFSRNIVIYKNPKAILWYSYKDRWKRERLKKCDRNLYWHTGGLNLEKTKRAITPEGDFNQWQAAGFDIQSLITEPPFLTPLKRNIDRITKEDFKLDRDSDIVKQLGLKQIPIERIGIEGFQS